MDKKVKKPVGVLLRNPLNIRYVGGYRWVGSDKKMTRNGFVYFTAWVWGWRAAIILLSMSYRNLGALSMRQKISRWAPQSDGNDTEGYIKYVCRKCGINENDAMPKIQDDVLLWAKVLIAMASMEIGADFVGKECLHGLVQALEYSCGKNILQIVDEQALQDILESYKMESKP